MDSLSLRLSQGHHTKKIKFVVELFFFSLKWPKIYIRGTNLIYGAQIFQSAQNKITIRHHI